MKSDGAVVEFDRTRKLSLFVGVLPLLEKLGQDPKEARTPQAMLAFARAYEGLGRTEEAMGHYQAVLATYPNRTTTRQYLGEAYLQLGQPDKARQQLAEIAQRCGLACEDYRSLADEIAKFEKPAG